MNEIWIVVILVLIFAIFIALVVFYGLVFWHWWNDAKSRYLRPSKSVPSSNPAVLAMGHSAGGKLPR